MKKISILLLTIASLANAATLNTVGSVTTTVLSGTSLRVDWTDTATNIGYRVSRCTGNAGACNGAADSSYTLVAVTGVNVKTFTDTGLTVTQAYTYRVIEDPYMFATGTPTSTTTTTAAATTTTINTTTTITTTTTATGSTTTTQPTQNLVSYLPAIGAANDVVIDSSTNRAFVANPAFGMTVVSLSTLPSALTAIAGPNAPGFSARAQGHPICQNGGVAIVAGTSGLVVMDVSSLNPFAVVKSTITGFTFVSCAISGTKAYVIFVQSGNPPTTKLGIYDISNLTNPILRGSVLVPPSESVKISGTTAFLAAGTSGLVIVDASNPVTPIITGTLDTAGTAVDVEISGTTTYVADTTSIRVINVSNINAPVEIGSAAVTATSVALTGSVLVATDSANFRTIDVSTPSSPIIRGAANAFQGARIAATGNTVLLASSDTNLQKGLVAYDISTVTAPMLLTNLWDIFPTTGIAVNNFTNIAVASINSGVTRGLAVIDVSLPNAPMRRAIMSDGGRGMAGTAISGNTAYTIETVSGNPAHGDLITVNVSTPTNPTILGRVTIPGAPTMLKILGSTVFGPIGTLGLLVVNVGNATNPSIVTTFNTSGNATGIDITGTTAFVANGGSITALDVGNPSGIIQLGSISASASAVSILNSSQAWITDANNIRAVNISNPAAMTLGTAVPARGARDIIAMGTRLFGATPRSLTHSNSVEGIQIWDIGTGTPVFVRQIAVPGTVGSQQGMLSGTGGFVYGADASALIDIVAPTL